MYIMRLFYITIVGLVAIVLVWVLWITGVPMQKQPLSRRQQEQLDALLPKDVVHGNTLRTYTSLEEAFDDLTGDIHGARHHVHMQFFKFESDTTGRQIGDMLVALSADGVQTRLLYDDFVCGAWKGYYHQLRRKGVEIAGYNPVHWPIPLKREYYRNHRKAVVVDGRVAYLGGVNIADRYLKGLPWGCWRDTMVRIEGPAVAAIQHSVLTDWCYATGQLLASPAYFPHITPQGKLPVRIITSGPIGDGPALMHHTASLLDRAERYAWFESPYFIPTDEIQKAMYGAAQRGVDVRLLLPPRGDRGEGTQLASKSFFSEAMEAGIKIAHYQPGYLHSKIIISDDTVAVVGSCNIDPRSHLLCEEIAAVVEDSSYAEELKEVFLADEAQSTYIDPASWTERPQKQKRQEAIMRLVAPLL